MPRKPFKDVAIICNSLPAAFNVDITYVLSCKEMMQGRHKLFYTFRAFCCKPLSQRTAQSSCE
eukprot:scaffold32_cov144-Skeletonema_menzelii.AAC.7